MKREFYFLIVIAVLLFSSCSSSKKFVYLQDMEMGHGYPYDTLYEAVVHIGDRLDITVTNKNPELALPFNSAGGSFQVGNGGSATAVSGGNKGYRVDNNGNINFPVLGELHVAGMKVSEVTELIRYRIIDGKYIKDPQVTLDFLNFKYSVLGAVGHTGSFSVNGDRITLLEAIANAGDVLPKGDIKRVAVIREEGGDRIMYMHDLRSKDLFESPCFYLQQNDIVYVEPRYRKQDKEDTGWKFFTTLLSLVTATCSVIWAVKK